MIYHKYIEIDNLEKVQEKSLAYILGLPKLPIGFGLLNWYSYIKQVPEVLTAFLRYNLRPVHGMTYISYADNFIPVHIDYKTPSRNQCRINIPLLNCEGSKTEFFVGGNYTPTIHANGETYFNLSDDTAIKVDEVEIIKPTVIRVQEPHRVINNPEKNPRICLSINTNIDSVFLLT